MSSNPAIDAVYAGDSDPSKANAGVDPDPNHLEGGGYHCSVRQLVAHGNGRDYSHVLPLDQGGDESRSSGQDTRRDTLGMILRTQRSITAIRTGSQLFRAVREVNGTLDGQRTINCDRALGGEQNYPPDATHLWHNHNGYLRWYMTDPARGFAEVPGILAVLNGNPMTEEQMAALNTAQNAALSETVRTLRRVEAALARVTAFLPQYTHWRYETITDPDTHEQVRAAVGCDEGAPGAVPNRLVDTIAGNAIQRNTTKRAAVVAAEVAKVGSAPTA